ncbi:alpha/beta hydrolase [Actinomadura sp. 7K507]|uniref:alpha/beta hydrolase family protein n=1 Tax=Actinomadura sp. 7K507 TaxID=2530365 RepID=UPI001050EB97|nr:alpha/beta hydrolase [Actinomadura sp. 7K507]TDC97403.1 alpha/beta hydrolase [Actinomadura sp. 7K507]
MRSVRTRTAVLATAAVTLAGTAGIVAVPAQAGDHGVPPGHRGRLLDSDPLTNAAALPSAAANRKITYTSEGVGGKRITVTGTVAIPEGEAPRGGWPVISWAHGTTGTADVCAPSADTPTGPAHDYLAYTERYLDKWVAKGYAVVQTDYEGLGTPGGHPYMNGVSHANTVADIVRAARKLDRRLGRDWYAVGHSQGGQAALFTAAQRQTPQDVRLKGSLALAPGSAISQTPGYVRAGLPGAQGALPFLFVMLTGAQAADPSLVPEDLVTEQAAPLVEATRTNACTAQLREMSADLPPEDVFRPDADLAPLETYLRSQEPLGLHLKVPTFVLQGMADTQVTPGATDSVVADLCKRYGGVTYGKFDGADHRALIDVSFEESLRYVEALRGGQTPPSDC